MSYYSANIQHQPFAQPPSKAMQAATSDFDGIPQCIANPMFEKDATSTDQVSPLDAERLTKGVLRVQSAIVPRLGDFHAILLDPPPKPAIETTAGIIKTPLGATRLEIVHLIRALLSSNNPEVNEMLIKLKTIPVLVVSFLLMAIVRYLTHLFVYL